EEEQADALSATDVLTVQPIRHPVTRTFSAWAGKFLTLEPYYHERLPEGFDEPPETIESAAQITQLFERFVRDMSEYVERAPEWTDMDVHFWPQARLLARTPLGPSLVMRQEEMSDGLAAITSHLKERGVSASPMPRINENVVPYRPEFVTTKALADIERLYGEDFATYGYSVDTPEAGNQELDLPWLNDLRGRNKRYGVVHRAAIRARRRVGELTDELEAMRKDIRAAKKREKELQESSSWKVTEPLRWASDRVSSTRPPKKRGS
ncbi:MAG: sulfotransferase family 2 domain-containing protein, partial [Candidatus Nanopelagicales bacterium]